MLSQTLPQLNLIRNKCRDMATRVSILSGAYGWVPFVSVPADIVLLIKSLESISRQFGLSKEQIDTYDFVIQAFLYELITKSGAEMLGKVLTKEVIAQSSEKLALRFVTREGTKYLPLVGPGVSIAISFGLMKCFLNNHINICYKISQEYLKSMES